MLTPEIEIKAGLRNIGSAIASTLSPVAMLASPLVCTIPLPCTFPLPGALLLPSPLLLPRNCLLPRTLRLFLLSLLGPLLRLLFLRLLGGLLLRLLFLRLLGSLLLLLWLLRLLGSLLLRLRLLSLLRPRLLLRLRVLSLLRSRLLLRLRLLSLLRPRLLLRLRLLSLLRPRLLLRSLLLRLLGALLLRLLRLCLWALFFFLLRVRRDKRSEKQKQGNGVGKSNELHSDSLLKLPIGCARRRPVRLSSVPPLARPPLWPWSSASSHPGGQAENRAGTTLAPPSTASLHGTYAPQPRPDFHLAPALVLLVEDEPSLPISDREELVVRRFPISWFREPRILSSVGQASRSDS